MIQFNRRNSGYTEASTEINQMIGAMTAGMSTRPYLMSDTMLELGAKYPGNLRLAAIAARMAYWAIVDWEDIDFMLPTELPANIQYRQELVACAGFERAERKWLINEDQYALYCGFAPHLITPGGRVIHGHVAYRPKGNSPFEIIEDIVNTAIYAELQGYSLRVDLAGDWWKYEVPFDEIFVDVFEFSRNDLPSPILDEARNKMITATETEWEQLACLKEGWYNEIGYAINSFVDHPFSFAPDIGIMYLRGGLALRTDTILPPAGMLWRELTWMSRFVRRRIVMSDDPVLGQMIHTGDPWVQDRSDQGEDSNLISQMQHYLEMWEAKLNWSCPTAPIVNAAQWSRVDRENFSQINPVYRYLIL